MTSRILAIETAVPETVLSQDRARDLLAGQPGRSRLGERLTRAAFDASNIATRRTVLGELAHGGSTPFLDDEVVLPASTGTRNALYAREAPALSIAAARRALDAAGVRPDEVTHVVTVSCTGFVSPGPDLALVKALGLPVTTARLHVGFMGCCGAFPALRAADAACAADPDAVVLVVCVELCTLHLGASDDPEQIVAMSLFGDGAAAAVVAARDSDSATLELDAFLTSVLPDSIDEMTWTIGDQGFVMRLSAQVPAHLGAGIRDALAPLFSDSGDAGSSADAGSAGSAGSAGTAAIDAWAVHPGGRAILDRVEEGLALPAGALADSRAVMAEFGNMSSGTVLFVLRRMLHGGVEGRVCAMAFGPGLTLEAATLVAHPAPAKDAA
ncbi:type III polyketide synthase [Salinibacterium sp. ZJ70]|uniref:type III polyketide synthase n=1 Tax=Salinibacterium sp. ZJ70 TaxID=2708084 RepID=UPI0014243EAB|nr:type III polyketide synthase [Salinibacterium sp. ZJ70]